MNKFNTADFDYILPKNFIAQEPVEPRDHSKLMILNRHSKEIDHSYFYNLPDFLKEGDLLVLNNTRVIPAKLTAKVKGKNSKIEILLLEELNSNCWKVLAKPGKKLKLGTKLSVSKEQEKYEIMPKLSQFKKMAQGLYFLTNQIY